MNTLDKYRVLPVLISYWWSSLLKIWCKQTLNDSSQKFTTGTATSTHLLPGIDWWNQLIMRL